VNINVHIYTLKIFNKGTPVYGVHNHR
jgi:hypothetical protein